LFSLIRFTFSSIPETGKGEFVVADKGCSTPKVICGSPYGSSVINSPIFQEKCRLPAIPSLLPLLIVSGDTDCAWHKNALMDNVTSIIAFIFFIYQ
jgi:hypothetical protein